MPVVCRVGPGPGDAVNCITVVTRGNERPNIDPSFTEVPAPPNRAEVSRKFDFSDRLNDSGENNRRRWEEVACAH